MATTNEDDFDKINAGWNCAHERQILTRSTNSAGAVGICYQCQDCGAAVSRPAKDKMDLSTLQEFDDDFRQRWNADMNRKSTEAYKKRAEDRQREIAQAQAAVIEENADWWISYNKYLKSKEWADMRLKVLARYNYLCQGCLHNKAVQVHHLSYTCYNDHGRSLALELTAICLACHILLHPHMAEIQNNHISNARIS